MLFLAHMEPSYKEENKHSFLRPLSFCLLGNHFTVFLEQDIFLSWRAREVSAALVLWMVAWWVAWTKPLQIRLQPCACKPQTLAIKWWHCYLPNFVRRWYHNVPAGPGDIGHTDRHLPQGAPGLEESWGLEWPYVILGFLRFLPQAMWHMDHVQQESSPKLGGKWRGEKWSLFENDNPHTLSSGKWTCLCPDKFCGLSLGPHICVLSSLTMYQLSGLES